MVVDSGVVVVVGDCLVVSVFEWPGKEVWLTSLWREMPVCEQNRPSRVKQGGEMMKRSNHGFLRDLILLRSAGSAGAR